MIGSLLFRVSMTYWVRVHLTARQLASSHISPKEDVVSTVLEEHKEIRDRILQNRLYRDYAHCCTEMTGVLLVHKPSYRKSGNGNENSAIFMSLKNMWTRCDKRKWGRKLARRNRYNSGAFGVHERIILKSTLRKYVVNKWTRFK